MQEWTESDAPERPWAFQLALCLLGPLFFLSFLLSLLSPLPLLYLHAGTHNAAKGRVWALIALFVGVTIAFSIKGWMGAVGFFLFASLPAAVLAEIFLRQKGTEWAVAGAMIAVALGGLIVMAAAKAQGTDLVEIGKNALHTQVQAVADGILSRNENLPDETKEELQNLKATPSLLYPELPGIALSVLLLLCLLPSLALIRWNPKGFLRRAGIPRDFLRKWKTPDWLVWVALLCGAFQVFEYSPLTEITGNVLKPLLVIYFFQGMSILAYFLDSLRLRGPLRIFLYGTGLLFLTPMVVSFGFFDIWFNFRGRHRPKAEEEREP